jgi:2-keto-4-pentenoate hydratase/2-oxohepta-3-ene-1,7-dioic acid hydratase in catechol pathway
MKLVHYEKAGATRVGLVDKTRIVDLVEFAKELGMPVFLGITRIDDILSQGLLELLQEAAPRIAAIRGGVPFDSATLRSPILNPEKILLVARNYLSHNKEQDARPPVEPYFFTKFRNALIGPDEPILIPRISTKADWEVELAVIIGRAGKNVERKNAMDHVAGYAVANDVSFRDLQFSTRSDKAPVTLGNNWVKGKGLDSSLPIGPWLVTKDEIPDPNDLEISLRVNGEIKQHSKTSDMIFRIDSLIEYVSAGMTLKPGDIISTGTPEGVAVFTGEPFLKDGDVVEATISGIGTLRNPVRAE